MPIRIFFVQGNKLINQLESDINQWRKDLGPKAEVTHVATSARSTKMMPKAGRRALLSRSGTNFRRQDRAIRPRRG